MINVSAMESSVTFEDVVFQYVEGRKILNKLSFTVPAGKKIAIVGGSGSGYVTPGWNTSAISWTSTIFKHHKNWAWMQNW